MIPKWKAFHDDDINEDNIPLDPRVLDSKFEMRSTYMNYIPQEDIEYRLDLKWKQSRQQQLADKNSQEEMNELISRWGNDKAILQDEIYRKAISMDT